MPGIAKSDLSSDLNTAKTTGHLPLFNDEATVDEISQTTNLRSIIREGVLSEVFGMK